MQRVLGGKGGGERNEGMMSLVRYRTASGEEEGGGVEGLLERWVVWLKRGI